MHELQTGSSPERRGLLRVLFLWDRTVSEQAGRSRILLPACRVALKGGELMLPSIVGSFKSSLGHRKFLLNSGFNIAARRYHAVDQEIDIWPVAGYLSEGICLSAPDSTGAYHFGGQITLRF